MPARRMSAVISLYDRSITRGERAAQESDRSIARGNRSISRGARSVSRDARSIPENDRSTSARDRDKSPRDRRNSDGDTCKTPDVGCNGRGNRCDVRYDRRKAGRYANWSAGERDPCQHDRGVTRHDGDFALRAPRSAYQLGTFRRAVF